MLEYISDKDTLDEPLTTLELRITTVRAHDGNSKDEAYVNVVFANGTRLFEPYNLKIDGGLPDGPHTNTVPLPVPPGLPQRLRDVAEVFVRKDSAMGQHDPDPPPPQSDPPPPPPIHHGRDGWFLGSVLLFSNGNPLPLIGMSQVHQFLDDDPNVLMLADWSTSSICVAQATDAWHPLARAGYRTLGPVIGQVSDTSAVVLYRVDREGLYRFYATDTITNQVVADITLGLAPTRRFEFSGLEPNKQYDFKLFFVRGVEQTEIPDASGSLWTYPPEGTPRKFALAFGSCGGSEFQMAQGAFTAMRTLVEAPPPGVEPVKLFVHLGDSFYFYDNVTPEGPPEGVATVRAAHVSNRRHLEFLDLARVVPCCGIWDDHDFASNNEYSDAVNPTLRGQAIAAWLDYWGNREWISRERSQGISARISYGLVDVYLLDGRFKRDPDHGVYFGAELIADLLGSIDERGPRVVVLATGSNWNNLGKGEEDYGDKSYKTEREGLYADLANRMGDKINGLLLLSGDNHVNEIFHVKLSHDQMAPEFMASPFTLKDDLKDAQDIDRERIASFSTAEDGGRRGFATLTIDASRGVRAVTATVRYYQEASAMLYQERQYVVVNGGFQPA